MFFLHCLAALGFPKKGDWWEWRGSNWESWTAMWKLTPLSFGLPQRLEWFGGVEWRSWASAELGGQSGLQTVELELRQSSSRKKNKKNQMHAKRRPSSPPFIWRKRKSLFGPVCHVSLVGESLAGLLPATGSAPHVAVLHPVHLATLLAFAADLPAEEERHKNLRQWFF